MIGKIAHTTIGRGKSYHFGGVGLFVLDRAPFVMAEQHKLPISRQEAAQVLAKWRRFEERVRTALIAQLVQLDPNGVWTDEDSLANGYKRLTLDEAAQCLADLLSEDESDDEPTLQEKGDDVYEAVRGDVDTGQVVAQIELLDNLIIDAIAGRTVKLGVHERHLLEGIEATLRRLSGDVEENDQEGGDPQSPA